MISLKFPPLQDFTGSCQNTKPQTQTPDVTCWRRTACGLLHFFSRLRNGQHYPTTVFNYMSFILLQRLLSLFPHFYTFLLWFYNYIWQSIFTGRQHLPDTSVTNSWLLQDHQLLHFCSSFMLIINICTSSYQLFLLLLMLTVFKKYHPILDCKRFLLQQQHWDLPLHNSGLKDTKYL